MDMVYKIWAFFGFLAFLQMSSLSMRFSKERRAERSESEHLPVGRGSDKNDMVKILESNLGKKMILDFNEDEEDWDLYDTDVTLLEIDGKWALLRMDTPKTHKTKLIRISSIKGISIIHNK